MFPRRRAVAACLALAMLGLSLLFLHAKSITPRALRISAIGGDDIGSPVQVRAHVHRAWTTGDGDPALVLIDYEDFATIRVAARPRAVAQPALVAPGATVDVVGSVFGSGSSVQIFSDAAGGVTVVSPPSSNLLPLEFVARNAVRLEGQRVLVRATLADVRTLVDPLHALLKADGSEVWAFSRDGWTAGRADVVGRLGLSSRGRCELFMGPEPHTIETTVAALAACPEVLLAQPVAVRGVQVIPGEPLGTSLLVKDLGDGPEFRMAAFVRGWDWRQDPRPLQIGNLVTVEGVVEYQATEARWRITGETPPAA